MSALAAIDPADIAATLVLADVLHEVRRAVARPIFRIHRGRIAPCQATALAFGWLIPVRADPRLLSPTEAGRAALADAARQREAEAIRAALPVHRKRLSMGEQS